LHATAPTYSARAARGAWSMVAPARAGFGVGAVDVRAKNTVAAMVADNATATRASRSALCPPHTFIAERLLLCRIDGDRDRFGVRRFDAIALGDALELLGIAELQLHGKLRIPQRLR